MPPGQWEGKSSQTVNSMASTGQVKVKVGGGRVRPGGRGGAGRAALAQYVLRHQAAEVATTNSGRRRRPSPCRVGLP